jgi:hypothetical protein
MNRSILTAAVFALFASTACATASGTIGAGQNASGGSNSFDNATATAERTERGMARAVRVENVAQLERLANRPGPCPMPRP